MHLSMSNIKCYTNVIPTSLYSKLLEKGMPELLETYVEVFDWLGTKGIIVHIHPDRYHYRRIDMWRYVCYSRHKFASGIAYGWIKTADEAIRCAIEQLI